MLSDKETAATEVEDMLKTLKDADKLLVEKTIRRKKTKSRAKSS